MNKPELVATVAEKTNYTKKQVEEISAAVFDCIVEALSKGDKAVISGFGTFEVHKRAKKTGRNPQTGEEILIGESKAPVFKSAKIFKDKVNQK